MSTPLYTPRGARGSASWADVAWETVDDRVRGGSSVSRVSLMSGGQLEFAGTLDITALGGAGFASQRTRDPFPIAVHAEQYTGLALALACTPSPPSTSHAHASASSFTAAQHDQPGPCSGPGPGPVRTFTLQLHTQPEEHRPDGRRKSAVVYEWDFAPVPDGRTLTASWSAFRPTFRGRPIEAPPLDPSKVTQWSLMARSLFGAQTGEFALPIESLAAVRAEGSAAQRAPAVAVPEANEPSQAGSSAADLEIKGSSGPGQSDAQWAQTQMLGLRASYGFALRTAASLVALLWTAWALTPDTAWHTIGVDWYPSRQWAFLLPAWSIVAVMTVYVVFVAYNLACTPPPDDMCTVTGTLRPVRCWTACRARTMPRALSCCADPRSHRADEYAHPVPPHLLPDAMPVPAAHAFAQRELALNIAAQGIYDLPLGAVSRALYAEGRG